MNHWFKLHDICYLWKNPCRFLDLLTPICYHLFYFKSRDTGRSRRPDFQRPKSLLEAESESADVVEQEHQNMVAELEAASADAPVADEAAPGPVQVDNIHINV